MKNNQIGKMLKKYRKINALSVNDVVLELNDKYGVNIAEKTVYGWESNQSHPTSDMLIALCDIYKVNNISDMISPSCNSKNFTITPEERLLIEQYRKNREMQTAVRKILDIKIQGK
uniref:XRE family transcriptional regulator n=1 Tax=Agathobacter sp. TaxID=2021311 RepID=UPI004056561A